MFILCYRSQFSVKNRLLQDTVVYSVYQKVSPILWKTFLRLNYFTISKHTYIWSWMVTEMMTRFWGMTAVVHLLITKYILKWEGIWTNSHYVSHFHSINVLSEWPVFTLSVVISRRPEQHDTRLAIKHIF